MYLASCQPYTNPQLPSHTHTCTHCFVRVHNSEWMHMPRHDLCYWKICSVRSPPLSFHFHSHSFLQINHTHLTQSVSLPALAVLPLSLFLSNSFSVFWLFVFLPLPFFLLFYFCHHMLSQLSHSLSTLPPAALCLRHHLRVRNQIKLPPSNFGICEFGDARTHMHSGSRPCWGMLISSPPSVFPFPPFLLTYSPPPTCSAYYLYLCSTSFFLYLFLFFSLRTSLCLSFPHKYIQCLIVKARKTGSLDLICIEARSN